jgi:death-on-curing protein
MADEVVAINAYEVGATGEPFLVLDHGKLDGALARPRNLFLYEDQDDVLTLAVALLMAVAKAHAFAQGNKRTAFFAMGVFLRANGYDLAVPDTRAAADVIVRAVAGEIEPAELETALEGYVIPISR